LADQLAAESSRKGIVVEATNSEQALTWNHFITHLQSLAFQTLSYPNSQETINTQSLEPFAKPSERADFILNHTNLANQS
jgi:hypothetical protein